MRAWLLAGAALLPGVAWAGTVTNPAAGVTPAQSAAIAGAAAKANNLSDLANTSQALVNLGGVPIGGSSAIINLGTPYSGGGNLVFRNGASGSSDFEGGPSYTNSYIFSQPYLYGHSAGGDLYHLWAQDGVKESTAPGFTLLNAYLNIAGPAAGNQESIAGTLIVGQTPTQMTAYQGVLAQTQMLAAMPVPGGFGWPGQIGNLVGTIETGWDYNSVSAPGLYLNYGHEVNQSYSTNVGVAENIGVALVDQSSGQNTTWGNGYPGLFTNIGYEINGGGYRCGYCFGKETGGWSLNPTMTLIGALNRSYGGAPPTVPTARYGVDLRPVTMTEGAIAVPGMGVDGSGNLSARSLTTTGSIQAKTATLSGATVQTPGTYAVWPTFTVQAPQLGGTTATITTASVAARAVLNFGSTGSGYSVNDTVSIAGLTGTSPTYTVTSIGAGGSITGLTQASAGSVTDIAQSSGAQPIAALTGGSGTGGVVFPYWALQADGVHLVPSSVIFAATGSGYAVGNTVTIAGDAGTAAVFTVSKVSAGGGIMMPLTLTTAGSQTALAAGTYHTATSNGSGVNASLQVGYGVATTTTTPGSGYLAYPLPLITSVQSGWGNADLVATMAPVIAPLSINGAIVDIGGGFTALNNVTAGNGASFVIKDSNGVVRCYLNALASGTINCFTGQTDSWQLGPVEAKTLTADNGLTSTGGATTLGATGITAADSSPISAKSAAFTYDATMHTIDASTATAAFAATLPACVTALSGRVYDLVKFDASANAVTLTAATTNAQTSVADTISGAATVALTTQWTAATVKCNGAGVWIRGASL